MCMDSRAAGRPFHKGPRPRFNKVFNQNQSDDEQIGDRAIEQSDRSRPVHPVQTASALGTLKVLYKCIQK